MKFLHFNDNAALESDVLLTRILYNRVGACVIDWNLLNRRIKYLMSLITDK